MKPHLGEIVVATYVTDTAYDARQTRNIILLLAFSVALMMTGFGIIMPVFARRLGEFGDGVEALGLMTMAFALAQLVASPLMGSLADRHGRRPLILLALTAFLAANVGYLLARSTGLFIAIRASAGFLTAGLFPAAMGVVADIVPEKQRAQWIGIIMGGYGVGFIFGPVIGGLLYDRWGFAAPFTTSAFMAVLALIAALVLVPESRPRQLRQREKLRQRRLEAAAGSEQSSSFWDSLPRPLYVLITLLLIDFVGSFAFAFIEPQMVFYVYDDLGWSTAEFGIVVGAYGLAMVLGQTLLGRTSDRFGRKPVILAGTILNSTLFIGMATAESYSMMMGYAVLAGLGSALIAPAISAFYLDITTKRYRSRVVGIKESALALGGVAGPSLVVVASRFMQPTSIFLAAGGLVLFSTVLAALLLREPSREHEEAMDIPWQVSRKRTMAAQATLRGIVMNAAQTRQSHRAI